MLRDNVPMPRQQGGLDRSLLSQITGQGIQSARILIPRTRVAGGGKLFSQAHVPQLPGTASEIQMPRKSGGRHPHPALEENSLLLRT